MNEYIYIYKLRYKYVSRMRLLCNKYQGVQEGRKEMFYVTMLIKVSENKFRIRGLSLIAVTGIHCRKFNQPCIYYKI